MNCIHKKIVGLSPKIIPDYHAIVIHRQRLKYKTDTFMHLHMLYTKFIYFCVNSFITPFHFKHPNLFQQQQPAASICEQKKKKYLQKMLKKKKKQTYSNNFFSNFIEQKNIRWKGYFLSICCHGVSVSRKKHTALYIHTLIHIYAIRAL